MKGILVERWQVALVAMKFENTNGSIVEGLSEWVFKVLTVLWQTTASLSHGEHNLSVVSWSNEELWVLSISLQKIFLVSVGDTTRVGLGPSGFESNTGPILWEVDVEEEGAEVILPVVVAHHESTIIGIEFELLIWG